MLASLQYRHECNRPTPAGRCHSRRGGYDFEGRNYRRNLYDRQNFGSSIFDVMEPGKYEADTMAPGFVHARYKLTLSTPSKSCKFFWKFRMYA